MEQGERTDLQPSANLQKVSRAEAAELLNVSERTVNAASKVKDEGAPELIAAVEAGLASVSAAAEVATTFPDNRQSANIPIRLKSAWRPVLEIQFFQPFHSSIVQAAPAG